MIVFINKENIMSFTNVGSADRLFRLIVGLVLIATPFIVGTSLTSISGIAMLVIGVVLMVTSVIKFCPLYKIVGASTAPKSSK